MFRIRRKNLCANGKFNHVSADLEFTGNMIGPGDFGVGGPTRRRGMIAFSDNPEQIDIHQMGRDVKRAPLCAQCRTRMFVVQGEPELHDDGVMWVIYRCSDCGLLEQSNL